MAEELQHLLEKINKDGVARAEAAADKIIASAKEKAARIVTEAENKAEATLKKAETDSVAFTERAANSLKQAARDVILSVSEALNKTFQAIVSRKVSESLTGDTLRNMLVKVVEAYCGQNGGESNITILLNSEQKQQVADSLMAELSAEMKKGLRIEGDDEIVSGFMVAVGDNKVQHDFSEESITDAICQLLRPGIAEIVRTAMSEQ